MPGLINKIPTMSDEQLLNLFKNAIRLLSKSNSTDAQLVITTVGQEWKKRLDLARTGMYSPQTPDIGMLATLGYHVGSVNGEKTPIRRKILAHLLEGELPMVSSAAYTDGWGAPNSGKRYEKLIHFFGSHLNNKAHADNSQAIIEWAEDLDWVQNNYAHLAK
jgi:hypothetical protein